MALSISLNFLFKACMRTKKEVINVIFRVVFATILQTLKELIFTIISKK